MNFFLKTSSQGDPILVLFKSWKSLYISDPRTTAAAKRKLALETYSLVTMAIVSQGYTYAMATMTVLIILMRMKPDNVKIENVIQMRSSLAL